MHDEPDPLSARRISDETQARARKVLALTLVGLGLAPLLLLAVGLVLNLFSGCAFGEASPDHCGDLNDPRVMVPALLTMAGFYVIFTFPLALIGGVLWLRLRRAARRSGPS